MAVQPFEINEFEQLVRHDQEEIEEMFVLLREKQPHLFDWVAAKFNTLESRRALQGVAFSAMALMLAEKRVAINELIKTINVLTDQSDLIGIVNSFDDTLIDDEILVQLQEWNNSNS